jgi:hypothetical protein
VVGTDGEGAMARPANGPGAALPLRASVPGTAEPRGVWITTPDDDSSVAVARATPSDLAHAGPAPDALRGAMEAAPAAAEAPAAAATDGGST